MVLVFSFLTLSVVLTSCSSSDDTEVTQTNPNDLVVVAFKATGEGTSIENFARDKEGTKVLSLDGQPDNVTLVGVKINDVDVDELQSSFNFDGRNVTTKSTTPVGYYSISYRITNGATTSDPIEPQPFTVFHNETKTFDNVSATIYSFNPSFLDDTINPSDHSQPELVDGVPLVVVNTRTLNGIPYQFLVGTRLYQISLFSPTNTDYNFSNTTGYTNWAICKLSLVTNSEYLLPSDVIINIQVRTKKYDQDPNNPNNPTIMFYQLKLDSDVLNYLDFTNNTLYPSTFVTFSTDTI